MRKFSHSFPSLHSERVPFVYSYLLLLDKTNKDSFKQHISGCVPRVYDSQDLTCACRLRVCDSGSGHDGTHPPI